MAQDTPIGVCISALKEALKKGSDDDAARPEVLECLSGRRMGTVSACVKAALGSADARAGALTLALASELRKYTARRRAERYRRKHGIVPRSSSFQQEAEDAELKEQSEKAEGAELKQQSKEAEDAELQQPQSKEAEDAELKQKETQDPRD